MNEHNDVVVSPNIIVVDASVNVANMPGNSRESSNQLRSVNYQYLLALIFQPAKKKTSPTAVM